MVEQRELVGPRKWPALCPVLQEAAGGMAAKARPGPRLRLVAKRSRVLKDKQMERAANASISCIA